MNLNDLAKKITTSYDIQEARSIVRLLLSDYFHLSLTDICCGALERLSADEQARLNSAIDRLNRGEPIQYITGKAFFVYSDGLNEAENRQQEQFSDERLLEILKTRPFESARQTIEMLKAEVETHRDGAEPNDDLTMLCLKVIKN